jgi:hypothetical protein
MATETTAVVQHSPLPWRVRPVVFDDWGLIRDADDRIAAKALRLLGDCDEMDRHRRDGTDPYDANAAFIVRAVNNHYALLETAKTLREALASLCRVMNTELDEQWHGVIARWEADMASLGIERGFGVRAQDVIAAAEAK